MTTYDKVLGRIIITCRELLQLFFFIILVSGCNASQKATSIPKVWDMKELRDTHKQDVKTQTNLMKSIDRLTNQVADLTTQNKTLQQKVNDLLSQISVGNKV